jgi:hypothetical protein
VFFSKRRRNFRVICIDWQVRLVSLIRLVHLQTDNFVCFFVSEPTNDKLPFHDEQMENGLKKIGASVFCFPFETAAYVYMYRYCGHPPTSLVGGQTSGRIPATLDSTCTVPVYKLICNCK